MTRTGGAGLANRRLLDQVVLEQLIERVYRPKEVISVELSTELIVSEAQRRSVSDSTK